VLRPVPITSKPAAASAIAAALPDARGGACYERDLLSRCQHWLPSIEITFVRL
jgi:hypothetical protein